MSTAKRIAIQNLTLLLALSVAFFFKSLQLTSLVVMVYLVIHLLSPRFPSLKKNKTSFDFFFLTLVTYQIIFTTGSLSSPVFFLSYFLLFAVSLLFEPSAALSLATFSSVFFLLGPRHDLLTDLLQIASIFLITPVALLFGSQYIKLVSKEQAMKVIGEDLKFIDNSTPQETQAVEEIKKELNGS